MRMSSILAALIMAALSNRAGHYIFILWFLLVSFFLLFSSPNLSRRTLDVYRTTTHGLSTNLECRSEMCCTWLAEIGLQDAKNRQKFAIWASSHNFVELYLRKCGTYRQSKKLVKQQYLLHICPQYGQLRPISGWDQSGSLGHLS